MCIKCVIGLIQEITNKGPIECVSCQAKEIELVYSPANGLLCNDCFEMHVKAEQKANMLHSGKLTLDLETEAQKP